MNGGRSKDLNHRPGRGAVVYVLGRQKSWTYATPDELVPGAGVNRLFFGWVRHCAVMCESHHAFSCQRPSRRHDFVVIRFGYYAWRKRSKSERVRRDAVSHHSDRGSPYASEDYSDALRACGARQSMSRQGDLGDNAVAASFFATLRAELIDHQRYAHPCCCRDARDPFDVNA